MIGTPLRVGNASGFYGDRFGAVREMLEGGPLDVLTGDYLAELTMLILGRSRLKDPGAGYAATFLRQMEESLALAVESGTKIVTNAGGLNPAGLARRLTELAERSGLTVAIAHVEGDDLLPRAGELGLTGGKYGAPLTANAYLGAWGIAECLRRGADIVVTGRVTDASLVVGPAAAHFGWARDDWDALAGATVAGHILECGAQATGGNFAFFSELAGELLAGELAGELSGELAGKANGEAAVQEIYNVKPLGFPLAEIHHDGSSVITKHPGTGGAVTTETVTAQLLYEIGAPAYLGPDVATHFDTIRLTQQADDRVSVTGVRGGPPPPTTKVCLNHLGGFRNEVTFVLTGLDIEAKAAWVRTQFLQVLPAVPRHLDWLLARTDHPDAAGEQEASALLRCVAKDPDQSTVGRAFSAAAVELALASYPGFTMTAPPGNGTPYGVYTPAYVDNAHITHTAVLPNGTRTAIPPAPTTTTTATPVADSGIGRARARKSVPSTRPRPGDVFVVAAPWETAERPLSAQLADAKASETQPTTEDDDATGADTRRGPETAATATGREPGRVQDSRQRDSRSGAADGALGGGARGRGRDPQVVGEGGGGSRVAGDGGSVARVGAGGERDDRVGGHARVDDEGDAVAEDLARRAGAAVAGGEAGVLPDDGQTPGFRRGPLGLVAGARSGDKGGDANIGVWARTDAQWEWLEGFLTDDTLKELLPETRGLVVRRYVLANLRAVNFVVEGLLQEGVSSSTRFDPQGKALGEWLRSRVVDIPEGIL